jgi:hypothetical protein
MAGPKDEVDPIAAHAELIGRVAIAWNDLHRVIGQLFEEFSDSEAPSRDIGHCDPTRRNAI